MEIENFYCEANINKIDLLWETFIADGTICDDALLPKTGSILKIKELALTTSISEIINF